MLLSPETAIPVIIIIIVVIIILSSSSLWEANYFNHVQILLPLNLSPISSKFIHAFDH